MPTSSPNKSSAPSSMGGLKTGTSSSPNYSVKNIEPVVIGTDVQARIFTLAPGEAIPWHYHEKSTDHYFVLKGSLTINYRDAGEHSNTLQVGCRHKIEPGTAHLISNESDEDCQFLL